MFCQIKLAVGDQKKFSDNAVNLNYTLKLIEIHNNGGKPTLYIFYFLTPLNKKLAFSNVFVSDKQ